jgi:Peptidase inhibitor I9
VARRKLMVGTSLVASATLSLLGLSGVSTSASASTHTTHARLLGNVGNGGAVIVILKNQHKNLSLRTRARTTAAFADQRSVLSSIKSHGGTKITQLVAINAVAATVSKSEISRLRTNPQVKEIEPDSNVVVQAPQTAQVAPSADLSTALCPTNPNKPLVEPEALADIHAYSPGHPDEANNIATGAGVVVANDGINALAGNPNFTRPDGTHVVINAPDYTTDDSDGEYYGDASSIAGQGDVVYDFSKELPFSGLPNGCTFVLRGDAPGASLVDTTTIVTPPSSDGQILESEATMIAGIDNAVRNQHADIISESYGYSNTPGAYATHYAANDAAVAAGVTVVVSSGDSGASGTVSSPATDPQVIAAGATNTLRLNAQAYGYTSWTNDNITPLSSGGAAPNNKIVDIVAPGYGGEAACSPTGTDCPTNTITEAFGGTSESCPLVAGAAADVIQAYRDSHGGTSPTPQLVKQILTGTATDVDSPADEQGAGLLNIYAAVRAAQELPGTTESPTTSSPHALVDTSGNQLDVTGAGGSTSSQAVTLYNASNKVSHVTGTFRALGAYAQLGSVVTEPVSAPNPALSVPAEGAQAAAPVTFTVAPGTDRLKTSMIWPDATNGAILSYDLIDPNGALTQISYDFGTPSTRAGSIGSVPDIGNTEVADPVAGTWTAIIRWANGRSHLQEAPNVPGTYTGNLSFEAETANYATSHATHVVTIAPNTSATVNVPVHLPITPGDHPESVQFSEKNGPTMSLPVSRRTLIPSTGGKFNTVITGTVGRGLGQISTFNINVPAGENNMTVKFNTPDASADNGMTFYLLNPSQQTVAEDTTPTRTLQGIGSTTPTAAAALVVPTPVAGVWEIDVKLNLTTSGNEFLQNVAGTVLFNAVKVGAPTGLPTVATTTISPSSPRTVSVQVKNTAGVGRSFSLTTANHDLATGAAATPVYIPADSTALLTTTITPTAAATTVVAGTLNVISNTSSTRNPTTQTFDQIPYTYTVGS